MTVWYKQTVHSGPGRQGTDVEYFHTTKPLSDALLKDLCAEARMEYEDGYQPAVAEIKQVVEVPTEVRAEMRKDALSRIAQAKSLLQALDALEVSDEVE